MKNFFNFTKVNKAKFTFCIVLVILSSLISIPVPYISKILIDNVLIGEKYFLLPKVCMMFVIVLVLQVIIARVSIYVLSNFFKKFEINIKKRIYDSILMGSVLKKTSSVGNLQTILASDVDLLIINLSSLVTVFFSNVTNLIGYVLILSFINYKLMLICVVFVPVYIFWISLLGSKIKKLNQDLQITKESLLQFVNISISGLVTIKIYHFVSKVQDKYEDIILKYANLGQKTIIYNNMISIISGIIISTASLLPLIVGVNFVRSGSITIGGLIAFNSYAALLFSPITSLIKLLPIYATSQVYESRISQVVDVHDPESSVDYDRINVIDSHINELNPVVRLENFKLYSNKNLLITCDEMEFNFGDTIHLQGHNSVGKTLLLKTLVNIYPHYKGNIYFFDNKIVQYSLPQISSKITYISNDQGIILDTVKEDLIGELMVNDIEIIEVLKLVRLDGIDNLSRGINSSRAEAIEMFSNGEMQKFRLARGLLRKPDVLLLDEVFSNIDEIQSEIIFNCIRTKYPTMIIVLVEHHMKFPMINVKSISVKNKELKWEQ